MGKTIKAICVDMDRLKRTKIDAHRLISRMRPGDTFLVLTLSNGNFRSTGVSHSEDLNRLCLGFLDMDPDIHRSMRFVSALYDLFNGKLEPTANAIATMDAMDEDDAE